MTREARLGKLLRRLLADPQTAGLDLDDPETTEVHRAVIGRKKFLRRIYGEWYGLLGGCIPDGPGRVLEIGSGAGFCKEVIPDAITSEIIRISGIDTVQNAHRLGFARESLKAIIMLNVLHHLSDVRGFFRSVQRSLRPEGVLAMIEPWNSGWGRFVYRKLHHEPFDPSAQTWEVPSSGPLSGGNGALPWIVFQRDRDTFDREFPQLRLGRVRLMMPVLYLLSGGMSMKPLAPGWMFPAVSVIERWMAPWAGRLGMFALITIRKLNTA